MPIFQEYITTDAPSARAVSPMVARRAPEIIMTLKEDQMSVGTQNGAWDPATPGKWCPEGYWQWGPGCLTTEQVRAACSNNVARNDPGFGPLCARHDEQDKKEKTKKTLMWLIPAGLAAAAGVYFITKKKRR